MDALLDHPDVRAISFVGSTPVARYVYARAAANGKRVQCQGGAKNPIVVLPDADMEMTTRIAADSAFGCAGQRCLAASVVDHRRRGRRRLHQPDCRCGRVAHVGYGLDEGVEMGPVISGAEPRADRGADRRRAWQTAPRPLVDGRGASVKGYERGNFVRPTVLADVHPASETARTEIFGPVLSVMRADDHRRGDCAS